MKSLVFSTFLVTLFYVLILTEADERIKLENGGYEGLVVAINKNIKPENSSKIIENLKDLFRHSSEFLYNATGGRAYFRKIMIIVPESWNIAADHIPYCYSDAHIRIGTTDPISGDGPYTLQPDDCGKPGKYIHLTDNFILNLNSKTRQEFGRPEKQLIREWTHLRYGVFDEYGIDGSDIYPPFYLTGGQIHPTSCIKNISGWAEKPDGTKCDIYPDGTVDYNCEFYADGNAHTEASLMYLPYLNSADYFCTREHGPREHNSLAPTPQNAKCDGRSTWDVIMSNRDFEGQIMPARPTTFEPEYLFRKTGQSSERKYVLVLDISGSMAGTRIDSLSYAARTFIKDVPDGSYVGIVSFSTDARIEQNLTQITDLNIRQKLSQAVPTRAEQSTAIGKGLLAAIQVLEQSKKGVEGSTIILVTDGGENVQPYIKEILPQITNSKVKVMSLAIGAAASENLEMLAAATGGKVDRVADGSNAAIKIEDVFTSFTGCEDDDDSISVYNKLVDVDEKVKSLVIPIDNQLGKNTIITVSVSIEFQQYFKNLNFDIISPNGTKYTCGDSNFKRDDSLNRCQLKLVQSIAGSYTVQIRKDIESVHLQVNVKASSQTRDPSDPPVSVNAWLSQLEVDHSLDQLTIFVQIKKGSYPVINAKVIATVESESKRQFQIVIKDMGNLDGLYSGKFTKADSNGRYSVTADVSYTNDTRIVIDKNLKGQIGPKIPANFNRTRNDKPKTSFDSSDFKYNPVKPPRPVKVDNVTIFIRIKPAGSFRITNYTNKNIVPPERVTDLKVTEVREDVRLIILQWTAPEDNGADGTVKEIDLRVTNLKETLLNENSFMQQTKVTPLMIKVGELKPLSGGSRQQVGIRLPDNFWISNSNVKGGDIYFALRSIDAAGNKAKISNIANAHFGYKLDKGPDVEPTPSPEPVSEIIETVYADKASVNESFFISEKYGIFTEWKITADRIENFNFTLRSPDNTLYDENYHSFSKDYDKSVARYHFDDAPHGLWNLTIKYGDHVKRYDANLKVFINSYRRNSYW